MSTFERKKGKRGKREGAKELSRILGAPVTQSQQFLGSPQSADVDGREGLHVEVKRTERLSINQALDQAAIDAGDNAPIVMHRRNHKRWMVIFYVDDLLDIVKAINGIRIRGRPVSSKSSK